MRLSIEPCTLRLRQPFAIAHGVSLSRENVLVHIAGGTGEAAAVPYLGERREAIVAYLEQLDLGAASEPCALDDLLSQLPAGSAAARAAVDIALHDAFGQELGQPLYRIFGLNPERIPPTSLTIPIGAPEQMAARARESGMPILKIKLGTDQDGPRLDAIAGATRATLRADANAGWTREQALALLPALAERGVELIEQPLAAGDLEGLAALSRLPRRPAIFADEGIRGTEDIVRHAGLVEGVVVKLAKSGGIRAALRDIQVARALGLDVLLSCMIESSVAVTAAAHIAPLCQKVDLDGPLLIEGDPYVGVEYAGARLRLPTTPGLGISPR
jgi:L-alanine-DL-glutamate epimerase-like enolase superfamily enzyme